MPLPFFLLGNIVLFVLQFLVPDRLRWFTVKAVNAAAWVGLIFMLISDDHNASTISQFGEGLAFFGLFFLVPFLFGTIVGTVLQKFLVTIARKALRAK